jgi:hypothetical protein
MVDTATTRTMWGRTFDLVTCEHCDRTIATREHLATIDDGIDHKQEEPELCDACKRRRSSERLTTLL